ncbi:ornithine cyclodeaminase family protein [Arthrobacter sp. PsM3]|uniref:ornithine cyclodeaminase family protein n=1 Tax=Arthrobacter sp. PsM3 TaxID=3030531 RepID=UPI00263AE9D0|nr:ornithine cyclodeaminase family protein [Arthrobacter sp. PsM3]MDN4645270.1 ornithine cyclodeaminase family protein [Arthrobacter sp. PsM3]
MDSPTGPSGQPPAPLFIDGGTVAAALTVREAVAAMESVLAFGFDPEMGAPRTRVETAAGTFMQMPASNGQYVGTKLLTITPGNATSESPVIQGLYVLFGGHDQRPLAVLDGVALTELRTSSVSAMGAMLLAGPGPKRLVVFGTGVQAWAHIVAFAELFELACVDIVGRNVEAAERLVKKAEAIGLAAALAGPEAVREADLIVCATASPTALFDGAMVKASAVVVAIGAHDREHRELDDSLLARATVCVESKESAAREAGDVIQAMESGAIAGPAQLITLADLVLKRREVAADRPAVFKTTGMPWEDLAVATALFEACTAGGSDHRHGGLEMQTVPRTGPGRSIDRPGTTLRNGRTDD